MEAVVTDAAFWRGRRVLVTGHTGFKGAWLCLWLHRLGAEVHGLALDPPTEPSLFELARVAELLASDARVDVRDVGAVQATVRRVEPEIVLHLAAQSLVQRAYADPVGTYATNVMGAVHLLEAIRSCTATRAVLVVTTDKCYENREWVWGYRETDSMGGYDPYSNSKGCTELVVSAYRSSYFNPSQYSAHGVALASARAGNVIGGGDWAVDRLVPDLIRAVVADEELLIRSPHAIRPWQHVLESVSGYLLLAERLVVDGPAVAEAWNFGPHDVDARPVAWVADTLVNLWGDGARWKVDANPHPHEAHYLKLDNSKARARLRWEPRWPLERALAETIDWVRQWTQHADMRAVCLGQIAEYETGKNR
jgi:CDP-glucose 4,6-dehydratase